MKEEFNARACPDAPDYEPHLWEGEFQDDNNCYAYAVNDRQTRKGCWPQPGGNAGISYDQHYSKPAHDHIWWAMRDGLLLAPCMMQQKGFYLVALAVDLKDGRWSGHNPGYHWWRQDSDGLWSHKPGANPVRREDESGNLIRNPRECDRGIYKHFVGFSWVPKGGLRVSPPAADPQGRKGWFPSLIPSWW